MRARASRRRADRAARRGIGALRRREAIDGIIFVGLWVVGFVAFSAGPMIASLVLSLTQYDIITPPRFVGPRNYATLLTQDPLVVHATVDTLTYAIVGVPLQIVVALVLAVLLNQDVRIRRLFRTLFYLPSMASGVAVAILWLWIFNPIGGPVNGLLTFVGVKHPPQWFNSAQWAMPALIIMSLWTVGPAMVIFLAGLQNIPKELHDAAAIDGAGALSRFLRVTLPLLSPVMFFNLVLGFIGAFQTFTNAFVITGGGPEDATYMYVLLLYRNAWVYNKMGYASAMAWLLAVVIMLVTFAQFRIGQRWVYYER